MRWGAHQFGVLLRQLRRLFLALLLPWLSVEGNDADQDEDRKVQCHDQQGLSCLPPEVLDHSACPGAEVEQVEEDQCRHNHSEGDHGVANAAEDQSAERCPSLRPSHGSGVLSGQGRVRDERLQI